MLLSDKIRDYLNKECVPVVGFADLRCLPPEVRDNFDFGIVIGLTYSKEAMRGNKNGSAERYYAEFTPINKRLPKLAMGVAELLIQKGYKALAKVQTMIVQNDDFRTVLPHKTVATLAGVGWIGKCALLVTEEFGSALRLIVILTDAPLDCGVPIKESRCDENCSICANVCPGHAPIGGLWRQGIERDTFFNAHACRPAARTHAKATLGIEETLCGLCISNCPFTKKALGYE